MLSLLFRRHKDQSSDLITSKLFNQDTFYKAFLKDLNKCRSEVIIECPFITLRRTSALLPTFRMLRKRGVSIIINTKDPIELDEYLQTQAKLSIPILQSIGIKILFTGNHHRKLAIIDRTILYEGSLNILSQKDSAEIMRRLVSESIAEETIQFIGLANFLNCL